MGLVPTQCCGNLTPKTGRTGRVRAPAAAALQVVKFHATGLQEMLMISGLVRGDRIPDFQRPNAAGKTVMLYDLQVGQPLTLLMIENVQSPDTRTALETLAQDAAWNAITRVITLRASVA